ncbi:hypothetical protein FRC11_008918 [Ceratobasidium sp. 423]|nr:hypothetical protein FRC11_008918 [Ceratobasidium sp. 423]
MILDPVSMSLGAAGRTPLSGMSIIELPVIVMSRSVIDQTTPKQRMHHCAGPESKTPQAKPALEAMSENPINLTCKKFTALHSAVGLALSVPFPAHPPPDRLTAKRISPPKRQYTYKYETLDHEGLINCAQEEFGLDNKCLKWDLRDARLRYIVMLPSTPFQVGGGWSQEVVGSLQPTGPPKRHLQDATDLSKGSSKRQCTEIMVDNDMAMEPETDNEPIGIEVSAHVVAEQIAAACPACSADIDRQPPQHGTQAPPPSREPTATTILDAQLSDASLHSLRGSLPPSHSCSLAKYGLLLPPPDDQPSVEALPALQGKPPPKVKEKFPHCITPVSGPVHAHLHNKLTDRAMHGVDRDGSQVPCPCANDQTDEGQPTDLDEASETESGSSTNTPQLAMHTSSSNCHMYCSHRSHIPSEPGANAKQSINANNTADGPSKPNSPNLTPSQLIRREHARAIAAKVHEEMAEMAPRRPRPMFATASQSPSSRSTAAVKCVGGTSRRLDPISAAHEDMLAFNRAVAQESCRPDELLDDDEEMLVQAEAYAKWKWPQHSGCIRKPKPLVRDVLGLARQVLTMAKVHLFAYALIEALMHQATSQMDLPDHLYEKPKDNIFEIMVNGIAMLRGKVKERLCEFATRVAGFRHTTMNQKLIKKNLTVNPCSGDYESPEIGHCIALAIFHGPNSVGVMYPDYFWDMPLTVIAFTLAMWQFCIEEWANGWWQTGNLGMASMCENEYSGTTFEPENDTPQAHNPRMCPDTPEPNAISVEEMDARLLETMRQNSLCSRMEELAAEEMAQPMNTDESDSEGPQALAEYNQHGVLTARAKGKGCAK